MKYFLPFQFAWLKSDKRLRLNADPEEPQEHGRLFAPGIKIALNGEALPEWIQLAPYGQHPTSERDADGKPESIQVFDSTDAQRLVKWFNFWPRKIARLARINAIKVWVGHPDFAPETWPDRIDLGDVMELKADVPGLDGKLGLAGRIRWNADARPHVLKHNFPSTAWDTEPQGDGTERPMVLWSVGMWHRPNIRAVQAVINAVAEDPNEPTDEPEHTMNLIEKIKALLIGAGLLKAEDSEETMLGGIGSMITTITWKREEEARQATMAAELKTALNAQADVTLSDGVTQAIARINATATEVAALTDQVNTLTADRDAARTARLNAVVDRLVETGRVSKADATAEGANSLRARLNAATGDAELATLLAAPVRLNTQSITLAHPVAVGEAHERTARLNAWMDEYQAKNQCDRNAAWKASETAAETMPIHAAVKAADEARAAKV